jgi:hypothetical protein
MWRKDPPFRLHRKPISNPYCISTRKPLLAKNFGDPTEYHQSPESHLGITLSRGSISAPLDLLILEMCQASQLPTHR